MTHKHTPGPWFDRPYNEFSDEIEILTAEGVYVCSIDCDGVFDDASSPEIKANARLIAAAPETKTQRDELLEALEWMVANDETNEGDEPLPDRGGQTWNDINAYWIDGLNKARAAIAKARGETQ